MKYVEISVCMPTFNGGLFLRQQLDSILLELRPLDEFIIVDDASSDSTLEILKNLCKSDRRVRLVVNTRNVGVVKAVEMALALATKDVIFLSDQDDIWLPGKIERALLLLAGKDVVAVLSNSEIFVDDKRTGALFFSMGRQPRFTIASQLYKNNFIGCCMCFKSTVLATALPFPKRISMHDWWLGVNALASGNAIFDEVPSILYRRHASNASPSLRRGIVIVIKSRFFDFISLISLFFRMIGKK